MSTNTWSDPWAGKQPQDFASGLSLGMIEAKRRDVLRTFQLRFHASADPELAATVRAMDDIDRLDRWLDAAVTAPTADVFEGMVTAGDAMARTVPSGG